MTFTVLQLVQPNNITLTIGFTGTLDDLRSSFLLVKGGILISLADRLLDIFRTIWCPYIVLV